MATERHAYVWPSDSRSNLNLEELFFVEGGKPENPEKNPRSKDETEPTYGEFISGERAFSPLLPD